MSCLEVVKLFAYIDFFADEKHVSWDRRNQSQCVPYYLSLA